MPLPDCLAKIPEDVAILGTSENPEFLEWDIQKFLEYVESGDALLDWNKRLAQRLKELRELF